MNSLSFDIPALRQAYIDGLTVSQVIEVVLDRIERVGDPGIFIHSENRNALTNRSKELGKFDPGYSPLWGVPFAVKDNIDVAKIPTTAGCPDFTYIPDRDAYSVSGLLKAGAIFVGKTNLDQFATGLVGLRTPFEPPKNAFDPSMIPGGSSSGSAVAVAHGIVSFALGTDTAGSGRIPAALNNVVGLKPTIGAISCSGVVYACRTLDTVSIFSLTVDDAHCVLNAVSGYDHSDPFSRKFSFGEIPSPPQCFRVGVPDRNSRIFFGDEIQAASFESTLEDIKALGGQILDLDFSPFYEVAEMLYDGAWIAERYAAIEDFIRQNPKSIHPVTYRVINEAEQLTAMDAFRGIYRLAELKRRTQPILDGVDILCVPSTPTLYKTSEVEEDPIGTNSRLGTYTNFVNLLDLCGITVPVSKRSDGLPGSVTLLGCAGSDNYVASIARTLHHGLNVKMGATSHALPPPNPVSSAVQAREIAIGVVGAHMSGMPLNSELLRLGGRFLRQSSTAPEYRLYALAGGPPKKPGLVRSDNGGSINLEIWALPKCNFGRFVESVPLPLGIGTIILESNELVKGFICETKGLEGAEDITAFGGWRNYMNNQNSSVV